MLKREEAFPGVEDDGNCMVWLLATPVDEFSGIITPSFEGVMEEVAGEDVKLILPELGGVFMPEEDEEDDAATLGSTEPRKC